MTDYHSIPGWFGSDCAAFYAKQVRDATEPAHFVEVGSWQGRSAAAMAEAIRDSGKLIRFDCVDHWRGTAGTSHDDLLADKSPDWLRAEFCRNLRRLSLWEYVNPVTGDSTEVAERYEDSSLDFVFLDGDHSAAAVEADVRAWAPKLKPGGTIAGHDWPVSDEAPQGVREGVTAALGPDASDIQHITGMLWKFGPVGTLGESDDYRVGRPPPVTYPHTFPGGQPWHPYLLRGFRDLGCTVTLSRTLTDEGHWCPAGTVAAGQPIHIAPLVVGQRRCWYDFSDFRESYGTHPAFLRGNPPPAYFKIQACPGDRPIGQTLAKLQLLDARDGGRLDENQGPPVDLIYLAADSDKTGLRRRAAAIAVEWMVGRPGDNIVGLYRFNPSRPEVPAAIQHGKLLPYDFWRNLRRARVCLALPGVEGDFTWRHTEAMALGTCLLTISTDQRWPGNWQGCWAECARDLSDLEDVLDHLLRDDAERRRLARLGRWYFETELAPARMAARVVRETA